MSLGRILRATDSNRRQDAMVSELLELAPSIIGGGPGPEPAVKPGQDCQDYHTHDAEYPAGHEARMRWLRKQSKTHKQACCPACGLWAVWIPREKPSH